MHRIVVALIVGVTAKVGFAHEGAEIELNFNARLTEEGLSGKVSLVDSDQLDGKWTAKKKTP